MRQTRPAPSTRHFRRSGPNLAMPPSVVGGISLSRFTPLLGRATSRCSSLRIPQRTAPRSDDLVIQVGGVSVDHMSSANHSKETDMRKKIAIALTAGVDAATVGIGATGTAQAAPKNAGAACVQEGIGFLKEAGLFTAAAQQDVDYGFLPAFD